MSPEQALKLVTEATASLTLNRQQHLVLLEAIKILTTAIKAEETKEKKK